MATARLAPLGRGADHRERHIQSLTDKLDDLRANSRIVGQVWGHEEHGEQCARWRSRREGIRRRERRRQAQRAEERAARSASFAADAAAAGTAGWLARKEAQLSIQPPSLDDDDSLEVSREVDEQDQDPLRVETETERRARTKQAQDMLGVSLDSRAVWPDGRKGALSESSLDVRTQWASVSAEGVSPDWASNPMRPGKGPFGAVKITQPHQAHRSFGRAATETLAVDHTSKYPHNSPMLHGHREQPLEEQHKEQGGGEVDLGIKYSFARAHRAPDGYQSRGSGCVAIGRAQEFRLNSERLAEMLTEITTRCSLTKDQSRLVGQQLASFASSGQAFIKYGRFIEIAKCAGISESDMSIYRQLFQTFDANNDAKLDLEELCDGLAYFKRRTLRAKLRLLYTMWCGRHCDEDVDHGGYYEAGLTKLQVYGLLATLIGADPKVAESLRAISNNTDAGSAGAGTTGLNMDNRKVSRKSIAGKAEHVKALREAQEASQKISPAELQLVLELFASIANDNATQIQVLLAKGVRLDVQNPADGRLPMDAANEGGHENAFLCLKAWAWQQEKDRLESMGKHARRGSEAIRVAMNAHWDNATQSSFSNGTAEDCSLGSNAGLAGKQDEEDDGTEQEQNKEQNEQEEEEGEEEQQQQQQHDLEEEEQEEDDNEVEQEEEEEVEQEEKQEEEEEEEEDGDDRAGCNGHGIEGDGMSGSVAAADKEASAISAAGVSAVSPFQWGELVFGFMQQALFTPLDAHGKGSMSFEEMYREIARSKQLGEFVKNGVFPVQGQLDLNRNDWGVLYGDYYEIGKHLRQRTGLRGPLLTMGAENTSKTDEFLGLPTLQLYMNEVARGRKDGMTGISPQDKVARRLRTTWRDHWHGRQAGWRRRKRADTEKYDSEVKRLSRRVWKSKLTHMQSKVAVTDAFKGRKAQQSKPQ